MKFQTFFPDVKNYIGNFNFGLDNDGEHLRLWDENEIMIDSLTYDNCSPWPVRPDGSGATLSLKTASCDNSLAQNWGSSLNFGTPGRTNEILTGRCDDILSGLPGTYLLKQNFPNPFNPLTLIQYYLPQQAPVRLELFTLTGEKVAILINTLQPAGYHTISWNGTDAHGTKVASGIYIYRLCIVGARKTVILSKKMILLK